MYGYSANMIMILWFSFDQSHSGIKGWNVFRVRLKILQCLHVLNCKNFERKTVLLFANNLILITGLAGALHYCSPLILCGRRVQIWCIVLYLFIGIVLWGKSGFKLCSHVCCQYLKSGSFFLSSTFTLVFVNIQKRTNISLQKPLYPNV